MKKGWLTLAVLIAFGFTAALMTCVDNEDGGRDDDTDDDTDDDDADDDDSEGWHIYTIDSEGDVGAWLSINVDSNDKVHISYYDCGELIEGECSNGDLKYATNASGKWQTFTLDSDGDVGIYGTSIAVDSSNKVHIAYHDYTNGDLKYATNSSGEWEVFTVIQGVLEGMFPSIAINSDNHVHISYSGIIYATNSSGTWEISKVGQGGDSSIAVDSDNKIHIGYSSGNLEYATNKSGTWQTFVIDDSMSLSHSNAGLSICIDSESNIHISYCNFYLGDLMYATNNSGAWQIFMIDSTGLVGYRSSIAIDSKNNIHISYSDETNSSLKYAINAQGAWQTFTLERVSSLNPDFNLYTSIAVDSDDKVHIAYYDYENGDLKYATNRPPD